ncbi:Hypothetical protein CINCED_3A002577 [Cinara cedri]|uniref:Uncharacterized protein n=1 Tax=Cinara cedri TaxID=506608 RepID=A0A5E4M3H4_9HEMI|nr:Hypothetical protein CINCED_3A002577 [Cinara cedri]
MNGNRKIEGQPKQVGSAGRHKMRRTNHAPTSTPTCLNCPTLCTATMADAIEAAKYIGRTKYNNRLDQHLQ